MAAKRKMIEMSEILNEWPNDATSSTSLDNAATDTSNFPEVDSLNDLFYYINFEEGTDPQQDIIEAPLASKDQDNADSSQRQQLVHRSLLGGPVSGSPPTPDRHGGSTSFSRSSPNGLSRESELEKNDGKVIVCFGMINRVDVKLVGDMSHIMSKLEIGDEKYQRLSLTTHNEHVIARFRDDELDFGWLRSQPTETLRPLISMPGVSFELVASTMTVQKTIQQAKKAVDTVVKAAINVYGPRQDASTIGEALSNGKLWLQRSHHKRQATVYENPHFLRLDGLDDNVQMPLAMNDIRLQRTASKTTRSEQLRRLLDEVYKEVDGSRRFKIMESGSRVTGQLHRHQKEALCFLLERETGDIDEEVRLWEKVSLNDGREEYRHRITKAKRPVQPVEKGGGILADDMGMGKSLSILALTANTLDVARDWANQESVEEHEQKTGRFTRSTLIVVPSALLITNWENEIKKHMQAGLTVVKYHGKGRPKGNRDILQDSDIVLTTYHIIATEFSPRFRRVPSTLHQLNWYRVVLDEAHIIRRPNTTFFKSCNALDAQSRWCLTGTPIQNKLADIGTLLIFIRAEPFNQPAVFRKWIELPFDGFLDDSDVIKRHLVLLLRSLCLRRPHELLNLPAPQPFTRYLKFSPEERESYEKARRTLARTINHQVGKYDNSVFGKFQMTLQLRIICNHGTFQRPFSWHRRSFLDENESIFNAYRGAEITCSGCEQPMPVLGSSLTGGMFDHCNHILCSECMDDFSTDVPLPAIGSARPCVLCASWNQRGVTNSAGTCGRQDEEAAELLGIPRKPVRKSEEDREQYFNWKGSSTKMEALIHDVQEDLASTKSIIFSCWTRTLHLISKHLEHAKIPHLHISGESSISQRQKKLDTFEKDSQMHVLIMTTGTGAVGLNLTCANRIFIVEPQWNPSVESQAIGRAIRLGQRKEVRVVRYLVDDTVEKDIQTQQDWKRNLAAMGFGETRTGVGPS